LIAFFEELSQKNSPFLIDGEHLHRVRPVTEDETGHSQISKGSWPKDRETIFPLQAAAGYAMVRGLFQHARNVLVEGMSEYFYLNVLSLLCRASGRAALPEDIYVTPCGGTPMVVKIAALFLGQHVRPVVPTSIMGGAQHETLCRIGRVDQRNVHMHRRRGGQDSCGIAKNSEKVFGVTYHLHFTANVKFSIDEDLRQTLAAITAPNEAPKIVVPTKFYDGSFKYAFEPEVKETEIPPDAVLAAIDSFSNAAMRLAPPAPEQEDTYSTIRKDLLEWTATAKARIEVYQNINAPEGAAELKAIHDEAHSKGRPETADVVQAFLAALTGPLNAAAAPPVLGRVVEEIKKNLPVFIYFENYGVLDSAIYLPRILEDLQRTPTEPKVRTIDAMFKHVRLTAAEIAELGRSQLQEKRIKGEEQTPEMIRQDQEKVELRSIKLNSASNDITARFTAWWKQRRHTIRYHADGDFFRIWVADDRRPGIEIELESRSHGFQWFFSFYLVFLVESEETHKEAVLLLDEPGLHLHPTAPA
jgi:hypothetical protein